MAESSSGAVKAAAEEAPSAGAITSDSELVELAEPLTSAGLHDDARGVYERAARLCPNRSAVGAGFASAAFEANRADDGIRALTRARQLEPAEVKYRVEMSYRAEAKRLATRAPSEPD